MTAPADIPAAADPIATGTAAGARRWTRLVLLAVLPLTGLVCQVLWYTPYPLSEGVGLLEDVARNPASHFLNPDTSYYRPAFHVTLWAIWHHAGSPAAAITGFKIVHVTAIVALVGLFVRHLRPRTALDAAAAAVAVCVLVASPGFRDNLEIPLSYTIVGMPAALAIWALLERAPHTWHGPAILALTLLAIGFKEQGLVVVPVVMAAWWAGAPGVRRGTVAVVAVLAAGYVVLRLANSGGWPLFQQDVGYGFTRLSPGEATARFGGAWLPWIFGYNAASTIANVLVSEPTAGVFRVTRSLLDGRPLPMELVEVVSSIAMTAVVAWWAWRSLGEAWRHGWSPDARLALVTAVALAGCGALSVNYSRDRLGGMAAVFYALSAFAALRAAASRAMAWPRARVVTCAVALLALSGLWQLRAIGTLEYVRETSAKTRREWLTDLSQRRVEFADRPVYRAVMEELVAQGVDPDAPQATRYRRAASRLVRGQ